MPSANDPKQNHLLRALSSDAFARLLPDLEFVPMPLGSSVYEADVPLDYVYFPTTSMVSLLYVMDNGDSAEIAVIGNDGMVGVSVFMGGAVMSSRAVVQNGGKGYRLTADTFNKEFGRGSSLQQVALRFTQALMAQMIQTGACNRHHTVEQQLCRWLLLTLDRLPGDSVTMTKQLIGNMLGVNRDGVAAATNKLQEEGSIRYDGRKIIVQDRKLLEETACECYSVVKKEVERLLTFERSREGAALSMPN